MMLAVHGPLFFPGLLIWTIQSCSSFLLPTGTVLQPHHQNSTDSLGASMDFPSVSVSKSRRKRFISSLDMAALLEYHNRVRSQVFPPAANMEYMVWDERLAKSAEAWASQCIWDHGPSQLMKFVGQNLAIYSGRYRSITELVKSWHDERQYYSYPYPQECMPSCPNKCSGSVCSHYTQMVWASSNRIGCAMNSCSNMNVWGNTWRQAVLLVCNYSIKGNWIGEAPYKMGRPCSACPPSYGGSCSNNLCFSGIKSNKVSWF